MEIRSISDLDLPKLLAIEHAAHAAPWSMDAFQRCWEANFPGWVLEENNEIIGFIFLAIQAGECHILNLCVHPDKQRLGYGKKLLLQALEWAKQQGAMIIYLEVRHSNLPAIKLYEQMHFQKIGERKNYYTTPQGKEDALVFARDLGIE